MLAFQMVGSHHKHHRSSPNFHRSSPSFHRSNPSFLSNQAFLWTLLACQTAVFPHRVSHFLHKARLFLHRHRAFNLVFLLHHNPLISALLRVLERQSKLLALQRLLLCGLARYCVFPEKKSDGSGLAFLDTLIHYYRYHAVPLLQIATRWLLLILSRISLQMHYLVWTKHS